jgi:dephospho-CoA kinase
MKTIFLAITGTQGSGKSVFTNIAREKYAIPTFRMGEIIIQECKKRGLEVNGRNMAKMASVLRFEGGKQVIAQKSVPIIKEITKAKPKVVIIDGVRSYDELVHFRQELGDVRLIAILSSLKTRKERVEKRKRIDAGGTTGDFEEREERELGFGLGDAITKADYFILNEEITKKQFISHIVKLLEKIIKEGK